MAAVEIAAGRLRGPSGYGGSRARSRQGSCMAESPKLTAEGGGGEEGERARVLPELSETLACRGRAVGSGGGKEDKGAGEEDEEEGAITSKAGDEGADEDKDDEEEGEVTADIHLIKLHYWKFGTTMKILLCIDDILFYFCYLRFCIHASLYLPSFKHWYRK